MLLKMLGFIMPGGTEWMLILIVLVLLFGASKLPKLARSAGEAMGEFKKARYTAEREVKQVVEEEADSVTEKEEDEDEEEVVE